MGTDINIKNEKLNCKENFNAAEILSKYKDIKKEHKKTKNSLLICSREILLLKIFLLFILLFKDY